MTEAKWLACLDPAPMLEYLHGPVTRQVEVHSGRRIPLERYLHRRISDRRLRLFACACCRRIAHLFTPERLARSLEFMAPMREYTQFGQFEPDCCVRAIESAERVAGGAGDHEQLAALRDAAHEVDYPSHTHAATVPVLGDMDWDLMATGSAGLAVECAAGRDFHEMSYVVRHAAEAVGRMRSQVSRDRPDRDLAELAAQADLLRDVAGNPFRPIPAIDPTWLTWNNNTVMRLAQAADNERLLPRGHLDVARLTVLADALEEAGSTEQAILDHLRSTGPHTRGCWAVDLLLARE
jgi:hypothetical protein